MSNKIGTGWRYWTGIDKCIYDLFDVGLEWRNIQEIGVIELIEKDGSYDRSIVRIGHSGLLIKWKFIETNRFNLEYHIKWSDELIRWMWEDGIDMKRGLEMTWGVAENVDEMIRIWRAKVLG